MVSFDVLLAKHFSSHSVTSADKHKNQYNSGVWCQARTDQSTVLATSMEALAQQYTPRPIKTEVGTLAKFYYAEEYHQKWMDRGMLEQL